MKKIGRSEIESIAVLFVFYVESMLLLDVIFRDDDITNFGALGLAVILAIISRAIPNATRKSKIIFIVSYTVLLILLELLLP